MRGTIDSFYKDYNPPTDQKAMKAMLKLYRDDVPAKFHPDFYVSIVDKKFKGSMISMLMICSPDQYFRVKQKLNAFLKKPVSEGPGE